MSPNFKIEADQKISNTFRRMGIRNFISASNFIKNLPYRRNVDKDDALCVFNDQGGTCSTKHALLKNLALENNFPDLRLMLGIFRMNAENTPRIKNVLDHYNLLEMPEAHNYLMYRNEIIDCTSTNSSPKDFQTDLISEIEIQPYQITQFKRDHHQNIIRGYLKLNSHIPYRSSNFWQIREQCISALQL